MSLEFTDYGPVYHMAYTKDMPGKDLIEVLSGNAAVQLAKAPNFTGLMNFGGKEHEVVSLGSGTADFLLHDTPLLDFIYELLEQRMRYYFDNETSRLKPKS
jgi:hypothetical protein